MLQIEINNLTKNYKNKIVLKNQNIKINNECYNILIGANGSGKTTLVKCINNLIAYDGYINNLEYKISYCPEKVVFPEYISLKNFLHLLVKTNKETFSNASKKINYYIKMFDLDKYSNTPIYKLSFGTKQKILIIQTLIKDADVYIFDEPMNGLDETSEKVFIGELRRLKEEDKLILIVTHQLYKYPFSQINKIELHNV